MVANPICSNLREVYVYLLIIQQKGGEKIMAGKPKKVLLKPNKKDGWDVCNEDAKRASSHHHTKAEAEKAATLKAKKEKAELFIFNKDNKIQDRRSFGNDPRKSKG